MNVQLKYPIIYNDMQVSELQLPERLKLKHIKAMDMATGEVGKIAALIGSIAELPISAVDQIDLEDFAVISETLGGFLDQYRAIGRT